MDANVAFREIYRLQDSVLASVNKLDTGFYLTGGTCLHRFILPRRYSDDLDFFCNDIDLFRDYYREIHAELKDTDLDMDVEIDTRDFVRLKINGKLKMDLVNDRVYRHGRTEKCPDGYAIDNIGNLLANKITAVIGRDEPKDLFDILTIRETGPVDWPLMLEIAEKKCAFERDYFLYRIQSFPADLFDLLAVIRDDYRVQYKKALPALLNDVKRQ
jgi:predicted nucleotidyltransferase component of viral defense system